MSILGLQNQSYNEMYKVLVFGLGVFVNLATMSRSHLIQLMTIRVSVVKKYGFQCRYVKNIVFNTQYIWLLEAAKIIYSLSSFKSVYLGRYKLVFYVLYIPGIVGQHTNMFLISRDGQIMFQASKQSMKSVQQQGIF